MGTKWKRGLAVLAVGLGVSGVSVSTAGATTQATESTQFQVDAEHSGYIDGAGVEPPLTEAWSEDLGQSNLETVIDGGRVYAFAAGPDAGGGEDPQYIEAFDLSTGALDWSAEVSTTAYGAYVNVDDGIVVVTVVDRDADASIDQLVVDGFDEATGGQLYSTVLSPNDYIATLPVSDGGVLYEGGGANGYVYAVNEKTGSQIWDTGPLPDSANPVVMADGTLVATGVCQDSEGLDPTTGAFVWQDESGCVGGGSGLAAFGDGEVWAEPSPATEGTLYDPSSGAILGQLNGFAPAFGYGEAVQVYYTGIGNSESPQTVQAFDPSTGAVRWSVSETSAGERWGAAPPLLADGSVFVQWVDGQLDALNPCTGVQEWNTTVTNGQYAVGEQSSLAAGDGYLVVPTASGIEAFKGSGSPPSVPDCSDPGSSGSGGSTGSGDTGGSSSNPPAGVTSPSAPQSPDSSSAEMTIPTVSTLTPTSPPVPITTSSLNEPLRLALLGIHCAFASKDATTVSCKLSVRGPTGRITARLWNGRHIVATSSHSLTAVRAASLLLRVDDPKHVRKNLNLALALTSGHSQLGRIIKTLSVG